jgi:metallo-beta-lactamase family protein
VFSGDLGRWSRPILHDPELVAAGDVVLVESTYGDRVHPDDPTAALARAVNETVERGGVLVVPAFAVGRTQELLWALRQLEDADRIPVLPVFVDSPMASNVTRIYARLRHGSARRSGEPTRPCTSSPPGWSRGLVEISSSRTR